MNETSLTTIVTGGPLDIAISGWLDAKFRKSTSQKTLKAYSTTIQQFRQGLHHEGIDLDGDPGRIMLYAQAYAGLSKVGKQIKASTYNNRLAILSSFYTYARKRGLVASNPIEVVERNKVQAYASAMPLTQEQASARLAAIDRSTMAGLRDYALLAVFLEVGWRSAEVASLSWGNIALQHGRAVVVCERAKGNEQIANTLSMATTAHLLTWLHGYYGAELGALALDAPLWVVLAPHNHGGRLSHQAISDITKKHLGVSKVHTTRHSAAVLWEQAGMPISEIQYRLGHKSLGTTSIYLQQLRRAENKYADSVAALLGIE
jgi:site-specific recombinase XerD